MELHHLIEEHVGHRCYRIGMRKRNEVCILGQSVDDLQDNGLAADLGEPFDEVH
jgi:hypothetical protein